MDLLARVHEYDLLDFGPSLYHQIRVKKYGLVLVIRSCDTLAIFRGGIKLKITNNDPINPGNLENNSTDISPALQFNYRMGLVYFQRVFLDQRKLLKTRFNTKFMKKRYFCGVFLWNRMKWHFHLPFFLTTNKFILAIKI